MPIGAGTGFAIFFALVTVSLIVVVALMSTGVIQTPTSMVEYVPCATGYGRNANQNCVLLMTECPDGHEKNANGACVKSIQCPPGFGKNVNNICQKLGGPNAVIGDDPIIGGPIITIDPIDPDEPIDDPDEPIDDPIIEEPPFDNPTTPIVPVCNRLTCGAGYFDTKSCACICPNGYSGEQCQDENLALICATTRCDARGGEIKDTSCGCVCHEGYVGVDCSCAVQDCGSGRFNNSRCECDCTGINCSGNGRPDKNQKCACVCNNGWDGANCNIPLPNVLCSSFKCDNGTRRANPCGCTCSPGFVGTSCSCQSRSCNNGRLNPESCLCECNSGWEGPNCDIPIPNILCSSVGCDNGTRTANPCGCNCNPGFVGTSCSCRSRSCNNGRLNPESCACVCDNGWQGPDCNIPITSILCSSTICRNGGTPNYADGKCGCRCPIERGWSGDDCTIGNPDILCQSMVCQNGGTKDLINGQCACRCPVDQSWSGLDCTIPNINVLCNNFQCQNGGTKTYVNGQCGCRCAPGFMGLNCGQRDCPSQPCGNGNWNLNTCQCDCQPGWSSTAGAPCSTADPAVVCSSFNCVNGTKGHNGQQCTCLCQNGWMGLDCNTPIPNTLCATTPCAAGQGNRTYNNGACGCQCMPGWKGEGCAQKDCGAASCVNGAFNNSCACVCAPGWKGPACDVQDCGAIECGINYRIMSAGDPNLGIRSDGGQSYFNSHILSDRCSTSSSCLFKFIRSKFDPDSYFIQANANPNLFLYVSSTTTDARPRWQDSCNLNTDNKLCQWKLLPSGSGRYQIISADDEDYSIMADAVLDDETVRINRRCTTSDTKCNWVLNRA